MKAELIEAIKAVSWKPTGDDAKVYLDDVLELVNGLVPDDAWVSVALSPPKETD